MRMNTDIRTVDEYISLASAEVRSILEQVRTIIKTCAPEASEMIRYGMPAYKMNGKPLVYFAAQTKHLGFYATPSGHSAFPELLAPYKQGKGSVQFSYKQPIPYDIIKQIVVFRVTELKNN